jgi:hypothetical protein
MGHKMEVIQSDDIYFGPRAGTFQSIAKVVSWTDGNVTLEIPQHGGFADMTAEEARALAESLTRHAELAEKNHV